MQKVYVIGPKEGSGPFKVGRSTDVERRRASLQTGNPQTLAVHFEMDTEDAAALEKLFHKTFAEKRLAGEWFNVPADVIVDALRSGMVREVSIEPVSLSMAAGSFNMWLHEMREHGVARSDAECARLLGITANGLLKMKKQGTDRRTALACRALLHRMEPYE